MSPDAQGTPNQELPAMRGERLGEIIRNPQQLGEIQEVAPETIFFPYFGNAIALLTDEGIVLVDASGYINGRTILQELRKRTDLPVHSIVITHAHLDHLPGAQHFIDEARDRGRPRPRVIAGARAWHRLRRYERMARQIRHNGAIQSMRPFEEPKPGVPLLPPWPEPDVLLDGRMTWQVGGEPFELFPALGETDDGVWLWAPKRNLVCAGDLFEWSVPNPGNPWKVQRYVEGWADALQAMAALHPELVLPGHGDVIRGDENVQTLLLETARYLRSIHDDVVERMNQGQWLEQILREVKPPTDLAGKRHLRPIYGHPQFIIHAVWRLYGGWFDGNPANFFPAGSDDQAREIVAAAGAEKLLARARELQDAGDLAMACHVADWVCKGQPENREAWALLRDLLDARAETEVNMMAAHTYRWGARGAEKHLD